MSSEEVLERVFVNAEGLIFRRGRILPQSFALPHYAEEYRQPSVYGRFLVKNYWLRRGALSVPAGIWAIDNVSRNYFHWMVESLTRLLFAERVRPDEGVLLLPSPYRQLAYVPFTLQAFPRIQRVGWIGGRVKARVERLIYVPRLPPQPPERLPDREGLAEIARRVTGISGEQGGARRIYFTRSDAWRRRARNEEDVVRLLRAHDFEIVHVDAARPWEQVRVSRGAEVMVGLHGAALTNLMFMPSGGRLLELRNPVRHWAVYEKLAKLLGVEYRSLVCEPAEDGCSLGDQHADLVVDLDELRDNLRDLVAT